MLRGSFDVAEKYSAKTLKQMDLSFFVLREIGFFLLVLLLRVLNLATTSGRLRKNSSKRAALWKNGATAPRKPSKINGALARAVATCLG